MATSPIVEKGASSSSILDVSKREDRRPGSQTQSVLYCKAESKIYIIANEASPS
jgi:hypothetical protein